MANTTDAGLSVCCTTEAIQIKGKNQTLKPIYYSCIFMLDNKLAVISLIHIHEDNNREFIFLGMHTIKTAKPKV